MQPSNEIKFHIHIHKIIGLAGIPTDLFWTNRQIGEWQEDSLWQLRIIPLVHAMSNSCHGERLPKGRPKARGSHTTCCSHSFPSDVARLSPALLLGTLSLHKIVTSPFHTKNKKACLVFPISSCLSLSSAIPLFA